MNLGCHGVGRYAGDRADFGTGDAFEIEEQYLPVGRVEPVDDREDQRHGTVAIGAFKGRGAGIGDLDILDRRPAALRVALVGKHVRRRAIMRDAPHPCAERTAAVEGGEALPQRDLQFLFEIAPQLGIGFIAAREPGERSAEAVDRFREKPILIPLGHAALQSFVSHALLVGGAATF
ncbi:protein of unknown function [uncultured Sphingopyxis sp.]|uniref:Uncharacterized protein n=1 Tax=uncultured Sphingopyxis sp. TaxID=310581 RepID=A0A1Y5PS56_9SPHN|nr:protein of unknown function [uncultured Sphingopyxis sp.]